MNEASVIVREIGSAGWLTLNRSKALHALDQDMCEIMTEALLDWSGRDDIALVIVDHAEGTRGFCAGGDIRMMAESGAKDGKAAQAFFRSEYRLNTLIHNYPKPYVAFMDGVTMGGGVGISVHGSARIATERTMFAMPESGIGLFPDVGGGWFLPRLEGELGTWLALTGARLKGEDVLAAGIATHFVSSDDLPALKAALLADGVEALKGGRTSAQPGWLEHADSLRSCFAHERVEDILAALEGANSPWATEQLEILRAKCPMTLKVALRQLREGGAMTRFEDNMRMEFRLGSRLVRRADFIEGVRAVIIDKDNAPKWSPSDVSDIRDPDVDAIFAPLETGELTFIEV